MTRRRRFALIAVATLAGLAVVLIVAALIVVRTPWFGNIVRSQVVSTIEGSTGAHAEIGSAALSQGGTELTLTNVVLRGKGAPFLRAQTIVLHFTESVLRGGKTVRSAAIDGPTVYVRVAPDGSTNMPRRPSQPGADPIRSLMRSEMESIAVNNGAVNVEDARRHLNVRGQNLRGRLLYNAQVPEYTGDISMAPVYVQSGGRQPIAIEVSLPVRIWDDSVAVSNGKLTSGQSDLNLSGTVTRVAAPVGSFRLNGVVDVGEISKAFGLSIPPELRNLPPVKVNAVAQLRNNQVEVTSAKLTLGSSELDITGTLRLAALTGSVRFDGSLDLAQFSRMLRLPGRPEGAVRVAGNAVLAGARNYRITARAGAAGVAFDAGPSRITGVNAASLVEAVPNRIAFTDLRVAALGGTFNGGGAIAGNRYRVDGTIRGFDTRYLAAAYAGRQLAWDGIVSGPVHAEGTLAAPIPAHMTAGANLTIVPGRGGVPLSGRIDAAYDGPRDSLTFANSWLALPHSRVDLSGTLGRLLQVRAASSDLDDLRPIVAPPITLASGRAAFTGTVAGPLANPVIAGQVSLTNFVVNGQRFDRFSAGIEASKSGLALRGAALRQGPMLAEFQGAVGLRDWKPLPAEPVNASGTIRNADIHALLAAAGRGSANITGRVDAAAQVSGTIGAPQATGSLTATAGAIYGEPYNRIEARLNYAPDRIQLVSASIDAPAGALTAAALYTRPPNQPRGMLEFHVATNGIQLGKLRTVAQREPGLAGTLVFKADGAGALEPAFRLTALDASLAARAVEMNGRPAGNLTATATTRGQNLAFQFVSDLAGSNIRGNGAWALTGDYPITAEVSFAPLNVGPVLALLNAPEAAQDVAGTVQGGLRVSGPVSRPRDLKGAVELTRVDLTTPGPGPGFALRNAGPVVATLNQLALRIQSAQFTGPATNVAFTGAIDLNAPVSADVRANGSVGLALIQTFYPSLSTSGRVLIDASVRGPLAALAANGSLRLERASVTAEDLPTGFSNANGTILFSGRQAVIEGITGEAGGGKFKISGIVGYSGGKMNFRAQATASNVRVRSPQQITVAVDADLNLVGTSSNSILSGTVSILEVAIHQQADFGSLLASTATPERVPTAPPAILAGMRFNVHILTAPGVQFQSSLTENLQGVANLQLRGTPLSPGMLGRITVNQGNIIFFGLKYTITRGNVSFYNTQRIQPILNASLATKAQGVDVTLTLTGPMDRLKLSYSSSPPLQFNEVVSLLATGRLPSSDPVLAATQPQLPEQNWEQMGASAILSQAIASPVAGRLERLFGVTRLQIAPNIAGPANRPQTTVTLYQQVTPNLNITYQQDLQQANPQAVRLEWALTRTWSAVATRQYDGTVALDFYYNFRIR